MKDSYDEINLIVTGFKFGTDKYASTVLYVYFKTNGYVIFFSGVFRILIAMLSGIIMYIHLKSNIVGGL